MGKQVDNKLRLLYLYKIMNESTDIDHPLSTTDLIKLMLDRYGLHVYRTTMTGDIELLKQFGLDICTIRSTQNKYYIASRLFDLAELSLLMDATLSSKFITDEKSKELVSKLETLASLHQVKGLKRNVHAEGRIKPENEQALSIVNRINDAINDGKKISFQYFQYNVKKEPQPRHNGEIYIFSPYSLIWNGDYYYVVGYSDKHHNISSFRVDRICSCPKILKFDMIAPPEDFDIVQYTNTMFRMFSSNRKEVELICENSLMDAIIDRFGKDVTTYAYDMRSFRAVVEIATNHVFYSWVFGFSGKVTILAPLRVKEEYFSMVKDSYEKLLP